MYRLVVFVLLPVVIACHPYKEPDISRSLADQVLIDWLVFPYLAPDVHDVQIWESKEGRGPWSQIEIRDLQTHYTTPRVRKVYSDASGFYVAELLDSNGAKVLWQIQGRDVREEFIFNPEMLETMPDLFVRSKGQWQRADMFGAGELFNRRLSVWESADGTWQNVHEGAFASYNFDPNATYAIWPSGPRGPYGITCSVELLRDAPQDPPEIIAAN